MAASDTPETQPADGATLPHDLHSSRSQLIWDVLLFQFKLLADGVRDIVLSPLSIIAGLMGLLRGGDDPYRYFRELQSTGRRTDAWINLFGEHQEGTSDQLVDPLREEVMRRTRPKDGNQA